MLFILDDLPREPSCWGLLQESELLLLCGSAGLVASGALLMSPCICQALPPTSLATGAPGLFFNNHFKDLTCSFGMVRD